MSNRILVACLSSVFFTAAATGCSSGGGASGSDDASGDSDLGDTTTGASSGSSGTSSSSGSSGASGSSGGGDATGSSGSSSGSTADAETDADATVSEPDADATVATDAPADTGPTGDGSTGNASYDGNAGNCGAWTAIGANANQVYVGETVKLTATAAGPVSANLGYTWTQATSDGGTIGVLGAPSDELAGPSDPMQFMCTSPGTTTVTVTVDDAPDGGACRRPRRPVDADHVRRPRPPASSRRGS